MKRYWLVLALASLLVGCSSVQTPAAPVKLLYPDELPQVQAVTVHDYENGAVKRADDPRLVKQLVDRLREARPAPASPPPDAQGFQYMLWLTLADRRQIHLIVWPDRSTVNLADPTVGTAWQVSGLSAVLTPLLPSEQDKQYMGRAQAIQIATAGTHGAGISDALLVESYHDRERGELTVWQVQLSGAPAPVIMDASTGDILDYLLGNGSDWVSSASPDQATIARARHSAEIEVHFLRDMNPSTLNAQTIQVVEAKHSRTLTEDYRFEYHDKTLVLRPVDPAFDFGTDNTITVTIKGTVQDATGQSMGKDLCWSFRT